ncbi:MAG: aminoglycoside phosphotransferase family protein [Thermoplasmataceae archaeon]
MKLISTEHEELIKQILPDERIDNVREIRAGWNNIVFLVNQKFIVKIPKSVSASDGIELEAEILKRIKRNISVDVPEYFSVLRNSHVSAAAYRYIKGCNMTTESIDAATCTVNPITEVEAPVLSDLMKQLGSILTSIHSITGKEIREVISRHRREPWRDYLSLRIENIRKAAISAFDSLDWARVKRFLDRIDEVSRSFNFKDRFIHGDFGGWNILVDIDMGMVTGIIDWAECRFGDPAWDFMELEYDYGHDISALAMDHYGLDIENMDERIETYLLLSGFLDIEYGLASNSAEYVGRGKKRVMNDVDAFLR